MNRRPTARRLVVIGLDSADLTLIERWSEKGLLPAFARLRREGTWVTLKNRGEFPSMSVWPSIYTGTHLGKNGIYFPVQIARGKPSLELVRPEQCGQLPFWINLEARGVQPVVVDVPFTYPVPGLKGLQISNWGSYERYDEPRSEPPREMRAIRRRFGRYPFGAELNRNVPISDRDFLGVRRKLLSGVPVKGELIRHLMRGRTWDFFMAVFAETHPAGHYFWDGHDSSSDPTSAAQSSSTLLDVYRRLDNEIAKIVAALDETTTVLITSGHGIGPNHSGWHLIPEVLARIGVAHAKYEDHKPRKKSRLFRVRESVPRKWRDAVSRSLPNRIRDYLRVHWATSNIDWLNGRVFSLPTDAHGLIRVNLEGRDPNGRIKPDTEYREICREVSRALKSLTDAETGKPIVEEVFVTDEVFPGPAREILPDLIVSWRNGKNIDQVSSPQTGNIGGKLPDLRGGNHRPEGFALLYGPAARKGHESEGHLLDIAPTILNFYGLEQPAAFDGSPWSHVLS